MRWASGVDLLAHTGFAEVLGKDQSRAQDFALFRSSCHQYHWDKGPALRYGLCPFHFVPGLFSEGPLHASQGTWIRAPPWHLGHEVLLCRRQLFCWSFYTDGDLRGNTVNTVGCFSLLRVQSYQGVRWGYQVLVVWSWWTTWLSPWGVAMCCVLLLAVFPLHVLSSDTLLGVRMRPLCTLFCSIGSTFQAMVCTTEIPKVVLCL